MQSQCSVQSAECGIKAKGVINKKEYKKKKKIRNNIIRIKKDKFPKTRKENGSEDKK